MANVIVDGLPENTKKTKLLYVFKNLLSKFQIRKFWIKELTDLKDTGTLNTITVKFFTQNEANTAVKALDGFIFRGAGNSIYPLDAWIDNDDRERRLSRSPPAHRFDRRPKEFSERARHNDYRKFSRDRERSRSPHYSREVSKLDLEIELLRKQRMIIEEERRLLLERKKLDLVKEFGPSALEDIESMERSRDRDRHYRPRHDREPYKPRPYSRPQMSERNRERYPPNPPKYAPSRNIQHKEKVQFKTSQTLPPFILPCKLLLTEMKPVMVKYASQKESYLLVKLIRASLRKRLAIILDNKPYLPASDIIQLYRSRHPVTSDEELVIKHLRDVKVCFLTLKEGDTKEEKDIAKAGIENTDGSVQSTRAELSTNAAKVKVEQEENLSNKVNVKVESDTATSAVVKQEIDVKEEKINDVEAETATTCQSVADMLSLNTLAEGKAALCLDTPAEVKAGVP